MKLCTVFILTLWSTGGAEYLKGACGPDEVFKCGPPLDITCETLGIANPINDKPCVQMCYCVDGYVRNDQGVCIPIKQCPLKTCGSNQIYNLCPPSCPPEMTCETFLSSKEQFCDPDLETRFCIPRCECKSGFVRKNTNGPCVNFKACTTDPSRVIFVIQEVFDEHF